MTDLTWQDLEREAPELKASIWPNESILAAIGLLLAQREARIKELEAQVAALSRAVEFLTRPRPKVGR